MRKAIMETNYLENVESKQRIGCSERLGIVAYTTKDSANSESWWGDTYTYGFHINPFSIECICGLLNCGADTL